MRRALAITSLLLVAGCGGVADPPEEGRGAPSRQAPSHEAPAQPGRAPGGGTEAIVSSVTDGDTIRLRGGARVRLVQVDTPEVRGDAECGGRAASAALEQQLPRGSRVRLVAEPASDRVDRYGRLLRYVYLGDRNLNVWLVQQGHAAPYFYDGERGRFAAQLQRAARDARAAHRGIWGSCPDAILDPSRGLETGPTQGADR